MKKILSFFERNGFEVSSRLSRFFGISTKYLRLFFIYIAFFSLGVWFLVYIMIAFLFRIKDFFYTKRSSVFDL